MGTRVPLLHMAMRGWESLAELQSSLLPVIHGDATDWTPPRPAQCAAELTGGLREAPRMWALQEGTLEKVAATMAPGFPGGNIGRITTFVSIHPAFSRARLFLDQLFTR